MDLANELDRRWLFPLRAAQWKGRLSSEHYIGRNHRLFSHPFARGIETYLRRENGELCASFDALPLTFVFENSQGRVVEAQGIHVASVLTLPDKRGKGHARALLREYFSAHPQKIAFLNSGVGTRYYSELGFRANPRPARVVVEEIRDGGAKSSVAVSLTAQEFLEQLTQRRRERVRAQGISVGVAIQTTPQLLDWHLERYRYFAEISRRELPEHLFWTVDGGCVAALPDFAQEQLDAFWIPEESSSVLSFLHGLARDFGLKRVRFMVRAAPPDEKDQDIPMLRFPAAPSGGAIVDSQLCDVW